MNLLKLIKKKRKPQIWSLVLFWVMGTAFVQAQTVSGTVSDSNGPLPGVNVVEKGTTNGTQTDFDGNYTISVSDDATLVFSYIGYKTVEVSSANAASVTLEEDAQNLDEVVVIGYGTVKKVDVTGSIASISAESLIKAPVSQIGQALQGRAAGVSIISNSGQPGSGPSIKIRGTGTLNNTDPYIIVDGVPGGLNNLNSADIKDIQVLKDASATAIYGSNGANGVILVTTKSGRKGKVKISINSSIGSRSLPTYDVLNSQDYAMLINEGRANDGAAPDFTQAEIAGFQTFDWGTLNQQTGYISNNQVSISGGTDATTYFVSYGYTDEKGTLKETGFNRHNLRINNEYQILKNVKLGHRITYNVRKQQTIPTTGAFLPNQAAINGYGWEPYIPFFDDNGGFSGAISQNLIHPLADVKFNIDEFTSRNFGINAYLDVTFLKNFNFVTTYAPGYGTRETYDFDAVTDPDGLGVSATGGINRGQNQLEVRGNRTSSYTWSNVLTYQNTFGKHNLTVTAGHEQQERTFFDIRAISRNFTDLFGENVVLSDATGDSAGNRVEESLLSYFGRVIYNFDDRYTLIGTIRRDGSSRFGPGQRFGTFPAVSGAWNIHNEGFMKNSDFFNQFKVRGGWGEIGNRNIGDLSFFNELAVGIDSRLDGLFGGVRAPGAATQAISNPLLQWESAVSTNVGVDLAFLDKFTLSIDYFNKDTKDAILFVAPTSEVSGVQNNTNFNVAEINNKGWEFALGYKDQFGDLGFSFNANMDMIDNEVTALDREAGFLAAGNVFGNQGFLRTEVGFPISYMFGLETDGIYQTQAEADAGARFPGGENDLPNGIEPQPLAGDIRYVDQNGDGVIDDDDRTQIGSPQADFNYSFNFAFDYKNFDLSIFFQGVQGNEIFSSLPFYFQSELSSNFHVSALDRWTGPGTSNTLPRLTETGRAKNVRISDRFVYDGSYLKLRNIQLGYTFPKQVTEKIGLDGLRVYVTADNILTFTNYDLGLDPEIGEQRDFDFNGSGQISTLNIGIDQGRWPPARTILFGLNLNL